MKSLFGHAKNVKDVVGHVKDANEVYTTLSRTWSGSSRSSSRH